MTGMQSPILTSQKITLERLPSGLHSYYRTLDAMADFVRRAASDYSLKLFVNRLLLNSGIKGHDFQQEIVTLFFSLVIRFAIHAIRLTWSWCKTHGEQSKRALGTVTTRLLCSVHCWLRRAMSRGSSAAARPKPRWIMFGAKFT